MVEHRVLVVMFTMFFDIVQQFFTMFVTFAFGMYHYRLLFATFPMPLNFFVSITLRSEFLLQFSMSCFVLFWCCFALWTVCSLASLALPGMSGFVSELMVFVGFATDDAYTLPFRIVVDGLAAVGVILTPIYLLSMLREIFYGKENVELASHSQLVDAEPREIYIVGCLLVPIIGIGLYPRLMTDTYRASMEALVARDESAMKVLTAPAGSSLIRQTPLRAPQLG